MTSSTKVPGVDQQKIHQESMELAPKAPGIVPFMEEEMVRFEAESARFQSGEIDNAEFTPFRLRHGVYGQRQADVQMIRVKIPGGILTADALDALGTVSEKYAPLDKGHITTRQNIQFHHLPLPDCPDILRFLGKVGLTSREACGNTVRNVVGAPTAGVCVEEVFDPTPYLTAYVRFGIRHPITQTFPRKFKTAFTGCDAHDHVAAAIQDLTYVSQVRVVDGVTQKGFKVFVAGGTSIMPRLAKPLYDFIPEEDYLRLALAIWTVFNNADSLRKNRMMARIKVLVDRIGVDAFRDMVEEELKNIGPIDPKPLMATDDIQQETPPSLPAISSNGQNGGGEYGRWKATNVTAQRQEGYRVVYVKPTRGDLNAKQFHALAEIVRRYTGGHAHATQEQNLALRWVPEGHLHDVWEALKAVDLAESGAHGITNIVSCPGTDSCKLGITSSMGLAKAVKEEVESWNGLLEDEGVQDIRIKISGCPNGCGLHHIANIGFHGAAVKGPDGEQLPAYELFLGGNYGGNRVEDSRIGTRIPKVKVPAKCVPDVIKQITSHYKEQKNEGESFNQFLDRVGLEQVGEIAAAAAAAAQSAAAGSDLYFDWDRTNIYKLERGEGECAV